MLLLGPRVLVDPSFSITRMAFATPSSAASRRATAVARSWYPWVLVSSTESGRQVGDSQPPNRQWGRSEPEVTYAFAPESLIADHGADQGGPAGAEAGCGRPGAAVVDDGGHPGEEPVVRDLVDHVDPVGGRLDPQPAPAGGHNGAQPGVGQRLEPRSRPRSVAFRPNPMLPNPT